MDWTDNYTENNLASSFSKEAKDTLSSIVKLWIAYCGMEISLRQFKQAVKIFEDAISDPVVSRSADIYLAYVDYCKTRGKLANAQKVYIKGLSSNLTQEEADRLWSNFLPFIQSQGSPSLTMQQLFEAVTSEAGLGSNLLIPPGPGALVVETVEESTIDVNDTVVIPIDNTQDNSISNTSQNLDDVESSSPMALEESYTVAESKSNEPCTTASFVESSMKDPSIGIDRVDVTVKLEKTASQAQPELPVDIRNVIDTTSQEIKSEDVKNNLSNRDIEATGVANSDIPTNLGGVGDDLDSVVGMTPEQLTRMYRHRPPMLFSAPNVEPTVFGLSILSPEETTELESFLGVNLSDIRYGQRQNKVDEYLDLVEGLWTTQALKERHFDSWFTDLKKLHEKEVPVSCPRTDRCKDKYLVSLLFLCTLSFSSPYRATFHTSGISPTVIMLSLIID